MRSIHALLLLLASLPQAFAQSAQPVLMRNPALSSTHIVFEFAGDLWSVPRSGGEATRLTSGIGNESSPVFSPDGLLVAFAGEYDGNTDVFTVPASGGVPKRITYHPAADQPVAFTPDGKSILFRSFRNSGTFGDRLFTIALDGAFPTQIPLVHAHRGAYSPDGKRFAYMPLGLQGAWRNYRGGQATRIYIADLADSKIEKAPRENSNDFSPMWIGERIYFLSDRYENVSILSYDTRTKKIADVLKNPASDIRSASAASDAIAFEQLGSIHLLDLKSGKARQVDIKVNADLPELRPRFVNVVNRVTSAALSPSGARVVFGARGDILTVPAEKGDIRNVTNTPGVHERFPSWSPDGKSIAYFSDESGEYQLHIRAQNGSGEAKKIDLGVPPSFFYEPNWSPDSKKISFFDKRLQTWYVDLEKGTPVKMDKDVYQERVQRRSPQWSPDSQWLTYAKVLPNHLRAVHIYSLESGISRQVTDGMSDASDPAFDKSGKYLFFMASTDAGASLGDDLSTFTRAVTRSPYVIVFRKDLPSPLAPESDEEKGAAAKPPAAAKTGPPKPDEAKAAEEVKQADGEKPPDAPKPPAKIEPVKIDFENIDQRILALPVPSRNYSQLLAGKSGIVYILELSSPLTRFGPQTVHKYDLNTRKFDKVMDNVVGFQLSANGEKMLWRQGERWTLAATGAPLKPGEGVLKLESMEIRIDPMAEWRQMYREVWRGERDFFYAPNHHGLDLKATQEKYQKYLETVASRSDLTYLFRAMLSEMSVSHLFAFGFPTGVPEVKRVRGGLLGADYKIENGRYRFERVYNGENWNPQLKAPLTQPGVHVATGEYLLAVNGRELRSSDNIYSFFENTAGKAVSLKIGPDPAGANSRDVTVTPIDDEFPLRQLSWMEDNRRRWIR